MTIPLAKVVVGKNLSPPLPGFPFWPPGALKYTPFGVGALLPSQLRDRLDFVEYADASRSRKLPYQSARLLTHSGWRTARLSFSEGFSSVEKEIRVAQRTSHERSKASVSSHPGGYAIERNAWREWALTAPVCDWARYVGLSYSGRWPNSSSISRALSTNIGSIRRRVFQRGSVRSASRRLIAHVD